MRAHQSHRLPNWAIGLVMVVVLVIASYLAFTKELPWGSKYTVQAVFESSSNIRPSSPVRIAGVNVGKVTSIEHLSPDDPAYTAQVGDDAPQGDGPPPTASVITMELEEDALPLHTDATMKLRPRLFLEGNLFVDLKPGSPNAPEAEDGYTFPAGQTAISVQLDQVLTTLQSDVRNDLQVLLDEFGNALDKYGGAQGFREVYKTSPGAFRYTAEVNEALLGTEPRDLSDLVVNLDSTIDALGRNPTALQNLVTNLRIVLGSFAAEDEALEAAIAELPEVLEVGQPALASLNSAFPSVRAFAREALPGVRSTPATLDAATPFLRQVRGLVSEDELRGLVADLRPTIPDLARLSDRTIPFLKQTRSLSSCFNEVVIPWSNDTINDPETPATGKVFEELGFALTGLSGESRSGDGNGQYFRVEAGGGTNTVVLPDTVLENGTTEDAVGVTPLPLLGGRPSLESSAKTPFRPDVACETNDPPNLESGQAADPPEQSQGSLVSGEATPELADAVESANGQYERIASLLRRGRTAKGAELRDSTLDEVNAALAEAVGMDYLLPLLEVRPTR
jgi:phospholipid/cholesterol/gamma-HCH transport system substrate-binding protein